MSYIKHSLPDDWNTEPFHSAHVKYICIGTKEIEAQWLQRWYGVPHKECYFIQYTSTQSADTYMHSSHIVLKPLPEGSDYKQKLKELKTERLLNGI